MIKCGADVNAVNKVSILCKKLVITLNHIAFYYYQDLWTPLHLAAQDGNDSIVEILIKCGADVNAVNKVSILYKKLVITLYHIAFYYYQNQWTPLQLAAQNGNDSLVESLIKCGADVNAVNKVSILYNKLVITLNHIAFYYY